MKEKIKVFLDFDGTLVNTPKQCIKMINKKYGINADYKSFKKYNFTDLHKEIDISKEFISEMFESEEFFEDVEFFENALYILKKHSEDFEYIFTTIGSEENLRRKDLFFKKHIDFEYKTEFILGNKMGKEMIDMSNGIIIDDHIDNMKGSNATLKILYTDSMREVEWNDYLKNIDCYIIEDWSHIDDIFCFVKKIGGVSF